MFISFENRYAFFVALDDRYWASVPIGNNRHGVVRIFRYNF
jgi:hypothetical protein